MLKNIFRKYHTKKLNVIDLEKSFKVKVAPGINIVGKIDRVDKLPNGTIEIVDYKTGKKPEEKKLAKNLQLPIYTLAATDPGTYNKKLSQVVLSLYYLQGPEKISFKIIDEEIKKTKERIIEIVVAIRSSDFVPPTNHRCILCPPPMAREA